MNQHLGTNRYCFLDFSCDLVIIAPKASAEGACIFSKFGYCGACVMGYYGTCDGLLWDVYAGYYDSV